MRNLFTRFSDITLTDPNADLNGALSYMINETGHTEGYTFTVEVKDKHCTINGTRDGFLDGNGQGPNVYKVTATSNVAGGTLQCSVKVSFAHENPGYQSRLKLKHHQYLNVGQYACNGTGTVYTSTSQGIPFKIYNETAKKDEHYFAVAAFPSNGNCPNGNASKGDGVYIYKWNGEQFEEFHFIKEDALYLEFFENDIEDQNKYLIVGTLDKITLWRYDKDKKFERESSYNDIIFESGIMSDVEYFKSKKENGEYQHFLMAVSLHIDPNAQDTKLYEWDDVNSKFKPYEWSADEEGNPRLGFPTKHAISASQFNIEGKDYVGIAQLSTKTSPIYTVNADNTGEPMTIEEGNEVDTYAAMHWEHFKVDNKDYLIVANQNNDSALRYWEDGKFKDHGDKIATPYILGWEPININGEQYLLSYSTKAAGAHVEMFYWCRKEEGHWCTDIQGGNNLKRIGAGEEIVETPGMYDPDADYKPFIRTPELHSMEIDGQLFLFRLDSSDNNKGEGVQVLQVSIS